MWVYIATGDPLVDIIYVVIFCPPAIYWVFSIKPTASVFPSQFAVVILPVDHIAAAR